MFESLLYAHEYPVGKDIVLNIPTVGEILDNGLAYSKMLDLFTSKPIDYMVALDDAGVDFTKITDWELFITLATGMQSVGIDSNILFKNVDLNNFVFVEPETVDGSISWLDTKTGCVIDEKLYRHISEAICLITGCTVNDRKPANEAARTYMIEVERRKMKRRKRKRTSTGLETLIVALVNTSEFKYDYESVRNLTIYQFNESVRQIMKKTAVDYRMHGVYSGTVDVDKLGKDDLNWLVH